MAFLILEEEEQLNFQMAVRTFFEYKEKLYFVLMNFFIRQVMSVTITGIFLKKKIFTF